MVEATAGQHNSGRTDSKTDESAVMHDYDSLIDIIWWHMFCETEALVDNSHVHADCPYCAHVLCQSWSLFVDPPFPFLFCRC